MERIDEGLCLLILRPALELARDEGVDVASVFEANGLGRSCQDSDRIDERTAEALLESLSHRLDPELTANGGAPLVLRAPKRTRYGDRGLFQFLLASAGTLREACALADRFYGMIGQTGRYRFIDEGNIARFQVAPRPGGRLFPNLAEFGFAMAAIAGWTLLGRTRSCLEVRFAHRRRFALRPYEEFFHAPVVFEAERTEIVGPSAYLDLPLPRSCAEVRDALTERATLSLRERAPASFIDRVKHAIMSGLDAEDGSLAAVSARLELGPRTLQRRLSEQGTSFEQLLDAVRQDLAMNWIANGSLPIAAVGKRLGFSDPSAFARAFRRWTSISPRRFRALRGVQLPDAAE